MEERRNEKISWIRPARGYGLRSIRTQAKLTALAVNLKRIAGLVSPYLEIILYNLGNESDFVKIKKDFPSKLSSQGRIFPAQRVTKNSEVMKPIT